MLTIRRWRRKDGSTIGVSTTKSSLCSTRTATMWKTLCLLWLTLFTFDFLQVSFARDEAVREEDVLVAGQHQAETDQEETWVRPEAEEEVTTQREQENESRSELVGKWQKNDEAVEPKWRDGDTVPLLPFPLPLPLLFPFPRFSRYSGDKIDANEAEGDHVRRRANYRSNNEQQNSLRSRKNVPLFYDYDNSNYQDYEDDDNRRGYRERQVPPRKRNSRDEIDQETVSPKESNKKKNEEQTLETVENRETASARYREIFEGRRNDYEQEFNDEEYLKPRPRKRKPPQNDEFALVKNHYEEGTSTSRPQSRANLRKTLPKSGQLLDNAMELKSLLKMQQEEGLSLSEILRQRNFTLNDLLKGKADVIDALKMKDTEESEEDRVQQPTRTTSSSFVKLPIGGKGDNWRKDELVSIVDSTLNPLPLGYSSNRSDIYKKLIPSIIEPSEKNLTASILPLPSLATVSDSMDLLRTALKSQNTAARTKVDARPDEDEIMEFSDFTDFTDQKKGRNGVSPVWLMMNNDDPMGSRNTNHHEEDRGSTLSIEKILSPTERSKLVDNFTLESKQQLVNVDETDDHRDASLEREYQNDAPIVYHQQPEHNTRMNSLIDQDQTTGIESVLPSTPETFSTDSWREENPAPRNHQGEPKEEEKKEKSYEIASEAEPEARAEIFELFASGSAGKRLERLLKSRNMSVEELIALRQRGSSKVHLAEVSRIKVQKLTDQDNINFQTTTPIPSGTDEQLPTNRQQTYERTINNYSTRSFLPNTTNCNSMSNTLDIVSPENGTTERSILHLPSKTSDQNSLSDTSKDDDEKEEVKEDHRTEKIIDLLTTFASMPFIKDIQREFVAQYDDEDEIKLSIKNNDTEATASVIQSGYVKEIIEENPDSIGMHNNFHQRRTNPVDRTVDDKRKTLSNVKPSIIASGAILGLTIVVFLAIFIVCRIRQKQKYRYRNTFSRAVFQGPVMAARKLSNSSSLSTVMVNVVATSTTKRPEKNQTNEPVPETMDSKSDIDNDSLDANDSWETIPDYMK